MAAGIGALVGQAGKDIGFVSGFLGGQKAGDKELRRLRADFAAAKKRRGEELSDTLGRVKAINTVRAAGANVEIASFNKTAGEGKAKQIAKRDIEELTRQYVARRDAIWDSQSAATENFQFTLGFSILTHSPPSTNSGNFAALEGLTGVGGTPFTPADGSGPSAGEIGSIADAFGGGEKVSSAAKPGTPSIDSSEIDIPYDPEGGIAATAPLGTQTYSLLGTRRNYAWYA